jgi:RluA family pseudouridine synthase
MNSKSHPSPVTLLFEDDWLLAVAKPAGLPSQPTLDPSRPSMQSELKSFLKKRDGREPYLALHHRLDRDTSGVLLFVKDPKANAGVGAMFSEKTAQKTYHALCALGAGCAESWEVKNYLGEKGREGKTVKYGSVKSGGDPAQTFFKELERLAEASLVEATPKTGRTHQIRVHLSECGHAILGDPLYGGPTTLMLPSGVRLKISRVMLHARSLGFRHPMTNEDVLVECDWPSDFAQVVERLRMNKTHQKMLKSPQGVPGAGESIDQLDF